MPPIRERELIKPPVGHLLVLFIAVPVVELALLIEIGQHQGHRRANAGATHHTEQLPAQMELHHRTHVTKSGSCFCAGPEAISVAGVTQVTVADAVGLPQPYVSDVTRQRYRTTTAENARKFADSTSVAPSRIPFPPFRRSGGCPGRC